MTDPHPISGRPADPLPTSWQRLLALSGIAFAVLFLFAWFLNSAVTPHYTAPNSDWAKCANARGVFPRGTGMVALLGAASFLITFLTTLDGTADGSVFGYGFFPGVVALVVWSIATSVASYRAVGPTVTSAPVTASQ